MNPLSEPMPDLKQLNRRPQGKIRSIPCCASFFLWVVVGGSWISLQAEEAKTEKVDDRTYLRSVQISVGRFQRPQERIVNRVFRDNGNFEFDPDTFLLGLRGESILTYKSALNGYFFTFGFKVPSGVEFILDYRTARSDGIWQDQDRHDPGLTTTGRDYSLPGTLKEWSNYYAETSVQYDALSLILQKKYGAEKGPYFILGGGLSNIRRSFLIKSPLFAYIKFSDPVMQFEASKNLKVNMTSWRFEAYSRVGWITQFFVEPYLKIGVNYQLNSLEREWLNRNVNSKAYPRGEGWLYNLGIAIHIFQTGGIIDMAYERQESYGIQRKPDHVLGLEYGKQGESILFKSETYLLQYIQEFKF